MWTEESRLPERAEAVKEPGHRKMGRDNSWGGAAIHDLASRLYNRRNEEAQMICWYLSTAHLKPFVSHINFTRASVSGSCHFS